MIKKMKAFTDWRAYGRLEGIRRWEGIWWMGGHIVKHVSQSVGFRARKQVL